MCLPKHILHQWFATFTVCNTFIALGIWMGWPSVVVPKLKSGEVPMSVSDGDISWIVALTDLGSLLTPLPSSYLVDIRGRVFTLRIVALVLLVASVLALTATFPFHLYAARFIVGAVKGTSFTIVPAYIAEIASPQIRGALTASIFIWSTIGVAATMTFGPYVSFTTLNVTTFIFPLLLLVFSFFIKDSAYFYCMREDYEAAKVAFQKHRGTKSDNEEDENMMELAGIREKARQEREQTKTFRMLFTKGNRQGLKIMAAVCFIQRFGGTTCVLSYGSVTLPTSSPWYPATTMMAFGWGGLLGGILSSFFVDCLGRKPLMLVSTIAICFIQGTSAVFYYFYQAEDSSVLSFSFIPHVNVILFSVFFSLGMKQMPVLFQGELFPTNFRSRASAFATMVSAVFAFVINIIYLNIQDTMGTYVMYSLFSLVNFFGVFLVLYYVQETKGKTLIELQDILSS